MKKTGRNMGRTASLRIRRAFFSWEVYKQNVTILTLVSHWGVLFFGPQKKLSQHSIRMTMIILGGKSFETRDE